MTSLARDEEAEGHRYRGRHHHRVHDRQWRRAFHLARWRSDAVRRSQGRCPQGRFRVPALLRWPGHVPAGSVENSILSGLDWFPTFVAAAGNPNITAGVAQGQADRGRSYKVHLDGYNQMDPITGKGPSARHEIFYLTESTVGGADRRLQVPFDGSAAGAGWAGRPRSTGLFDQPAPGSVRAHGLATGRERVAGLLRLVRVRVPAL